MTALPAKADISGSPSNATANAGFGTLHDYLTGLFGSAGTAATALSTLRAFGTGLLFNNGLAASVGSNALTVALKGADGNDPSATNPVLVGMRSATVTSGVTNLRSATAAASLVAPSGATLGQSNGVAARLWVALIDNAGTLELAVCNTQLGNGQIHPVNESGLISTTAIGTGADSAGVWYSTNARTNVPFRLLGYVESTQATAGTWATAPSVIQPMGPGVRRPGEEVQRVANITGALATGTTVMPNDDTIPQSTEGDQYLSQAIAPSSAINTLEIDAQLTLTSSSAAVDTMGAALFQDSTADAIAAVGIGQTAAGVRHRASLGHIMQAGTASSTTFKVRAGYGQAGTTTLNGTSGARRYGGVNYSFLRVREVMA